MAKLKVYIETSVLNFYYADDSPEKRDITRKLFKEIDKGNFDCFISNIVIDEIKDAKKERKEKLIELIGKYALKELKSNDNSYKLADNYIKEKLIPKKYYSDALHIAIAAVNEIDVVLSWNFKHIVRAKTEIGVNKTNKYLGYKTIVISSPEEVI